MDEAGVHDVRGGGCATPHIELNRPPSLGIFVAGEISIRELVGDLCCMPLEVKHSESR